MALFGELSYALIQSSTRAIGTILADVTVEESHRDEVIITQHPVEGGGVITDHAYKRPAELEIRCGFSNSSAGYVGYVQQQYRALLALQLARQPFSVYTGKRRYQNMLIRGIQVTTDQHSENILMASVSLQEIIRVSTQTTSATGSSSDSSTPGGNGSQADPASTGSTTNSGNVEAQGVGSQAFAGAYGSGNAGPGNFNPDGGAVGDGGFGLGGVSSGAMPDGFSPTSVTLPEQSVTAPSAGGLQEVAPDQYNMFGVSP